VKLKLKWCAIFFILWSSVISQSINFKKAIEDIKRIEVENGSFKGYLNYLPFYLKRLSRYKNIYESFVINEVKESYSGNELIFNAPIENSKISTGLLTVENFNNELWFYTIIYSSDDFKIYYQNLWLQHHGKDYFLDSIYNADKIIHSSFSSDGKYLLVNTLNTLSDYYNPEQDNRIMVYDLSEIDQGNIKKEYIPCDKCADSYLVNNTLFFTIGRKDAYDGFNNKDIYMAPWGNLEDTTKIASNTKIIAISPDGRYILGSRFFDRQKNTCVILDVISKKYQMLLGRDYFKYQAFYSYYEKMFAFDFKGYLIYVDFPKSYPFDALNWRNEEIPDWTEKEFWGKYQHDLLPEKR